MVMNFVKNEELISFLKDLDFYRPCNIMTDELRELSICVLPNYLVMKQ